jgi:hypothetical protein
MVEESIAAGFALVILSFATIIFLFCTGVRVALWAYVKFF